MRMRRLPSHPAFRLEGRSRHFQSFWEVELTPGEETARHQHYESEEVIYLVTGQALVTIAQDARAVSPGEVVLVPPRTDHVIANRSSNVVHALTVESLLDLGQAPDGAAASLVADGPAGSTEEAPAAAPPVLITPAQAEEAARSSMRTIEQLVSDLPPDVDEARAIKTIVELFDIGGSLSEQIETSLGLDNPTGVEALVQVERRIMIAVVEITSRYRRRGGRFTWG